MTAICVEYLPAGVCTHASSPCETGGGPTTKAVIFAQLVTDYCRFETIRDSGDANAIPKCPEDLHYWANATRLRWR